MQVLYKKASEEYNDSFAGTRADLLRKCGISNHAELIEYANMRFENLPEQIKTLLNQNFS